MLGWWLVDVPLPLAWRWLVLVGTAVALTFGIHHFAIRALAPLRLAFGMRAVT